MNGLITHDEFNPHIVWQLNHVVSKLSDKSLGVNSPEALAELVESLPWMAEENRRHSAARALRDQFYDKYARCRAFIENHEDGDKFIAYLRKSIGAKKADRFVPLAYNFAVKTSLTDTDELGGNKFGGIPDFRSELRHVEKIPDKYKNPIEFALYRNWPICGGCQKHMRFVGQMAMPVEEYVIHYLTCVNRDGWYAPVSALGPRGNDIGGIGLSTTLNQFFACPCHPMDGSRDAAILRQPVWLYDELTGKSQNKTFRDEDYIAAAKAFMLENGLATDDEMGLNIPLQTIDGFTLGFDLEIWGDSKYDFSDMFDAFHEEFGWRQTDFILFGVPRSQQTEKRPFSTFGHNLFRQSPILNWNDDDHDITRQMYGCFRSSERTFGTVSCRMDNSNT